jgi:hypothetical protein
MVVTLSAVTACAPAPDQAQHSVGYYRSHEQEGAQVLKQCTNDPGSEGGRPDCVNAQEAARIEGIGSLKSLPPMGLPGGPAGRAPR